ncbi:helicase-related protein [Gracilimonas sediminicola]|uniref:helicase-related protein n=1 Tax=Gracilimonas sediminicola TaxID=2952158 RepID=UPI0038D3AA23
MSRRNPTVSAFEKISISDYPGIFGDFDNDGIQNVDDPHPQQAGDTETVEEVKLSEEIEKLIELRNEYQEALNEVMNKLKSIDVESKVKGRVKSPYSVINKLRRKRISGKIEKAEKGELYTKGLTDMVGCMIIVNDQYALNKVLEAIESGEVGSIFEHEDFYKNPLNGYRAHHFIVHTEDDISVEIQVKTKRMAAISSASHTAYKEGNLNSEELLRLTSLAVKADNHNEAAKKELDPLLADMDKLEQRLTVRENRAAPKTAYQKKLEKLQAEFRELLGMYYTLMSIDKMPVEVIDEAGQALEKVANTLHLDFDQELKSFQVAESPERSDSQTTGLALNEDLDLSQYQPINLTKSERQKINEASIKILEKQDREITLDDIKTLRKYTGAGGVGYASDAYKRGKMNEHYTSYSVIQMMWQKLQNMGVKAGNFLEPGSGIGNFAGFIPDRDKFQMVMVEKSPISSRISSLLFPNQQVIHGNFADVDLDRYNLNGAIGNVPFGNIKIYTRKDPLAGLKPNIHDYFILKSMDTVAPGSPIALITSTGTMDKKNSRLRKAMIERAQFVGAYRLPSTAFKENAATSVTTDILIFQKYPSGGANVDNELNNLFANTALSESVIIYEGEEYKAFYNPYYDQYPDHVLGEHIQGHDVQFYSRMGVKGELTGSIIEQVLSDGIEFPFALPETKRLHNHDDGIYLDLTRTYSSGSLVYHEGSFYEKQNKTFKKISVSQSNKERVRSACELLDVYSDFVTALAKGTGNIENLREAFKARTDSHIDQYGIPDEDDALRSEFKYDSRLYKLTTFVKRNPTTGELKYADIYEAESMYNKQYVPKLSDSKNMDELAIFGHSIGADLDLDYYHSVYEGGTADRAEVEKALKAHESFFYNPETDKFEYKYEYLSGNVRKKLDVAMENNLDKNIKALKEVVPEKVTIYEIGLSPRHIFTYLPAEAISDWLEDTLGYHKVELGLFKDKADLGNRFYMKFRDYSSYVDPSAQDMNLGWGNTAYSKIVLNYITDRDFDLHFYNENGDVLPNMTLKKAKEQGRKGLIQRARKVQRENKNRMLTKIPKDFENWVRVNASDELIDKIEKAYNYAYNSEVNPKFTGETIRFRGMSNTFYGEKNFKVFKHNRAVAEKLIWNGRGANCHDVGAGKTMSSIITNEAMLQQGAIKKPIFVVPGKVQEKWVEEYSMLFPDAKILNIKFADKESRKKELAMAQLYNWDAIFISTHSFKRLPLSPDVQKRILQERIEYFDEMIERFGELIEEDGAVSKSTQTSMIKRLEKQKEAFEQSIRDLSDIDREATDIFFDELGVDAIYVDEAHFYKNALGSAKASKLGISATNPSQRAEDMLQKTKWLYGQIGYRNVFLLTATPVVNSPIEVWHMLQLCAPDMLEENNIDSLDNFINLFIQEEIKVVKKTTGEYAEKMVVSGYFNMPEMRRLIDKVMDIKSYDQLQLFYEKTAENSDGKAVKPSFVRPDADYKNVVVSPSRVHKLLFDDIILRAENILDCMRDRDCETKDNFLVLTGDGSRIATDLRIYDGHFDGFDDKSLKIRPLLDRVQDSYQGIRENPENTRYRPVPEDIYGNFFYGAGEEEPRKNPPIRNQIIFCDFINTKDGNSYHQIIKNELVKRGIPAAEIAIINGSIIGTQGDSGKDRMVKSKDDKEELKKEVQDDFNAGKFRVLIGNKSIAEGMNLQKWTTDIHHMDVPYTPAEIQQRNGRGLRQGNNYSEVNIHNYLMEDSFDQYRLELVNKKQNWIDQLFYGTEREISSDDEAKSLNYEEMISATTSDPEIKQFFESKALLKTLTTKVSSLEAEKQRIEGSLIQAEKNVEDFVRRVDEAVERENQIKEATFDYDVTQAKKLINDDRLRVTYNYSPDYSNIKATIRAELVEDRRFASSFVTMKLEVPKTNENARVRIRLFPPNDTSRSMYNRTSWKGLKSMAENAMDELFGWDKEEVGSNRFSLIADETDFEAYYGLDLASEKTEDNTWEEIKNKHSMFNLSRWEPVIEEKVAALFIAFEKAWINQVDSRLKTLAEGKAERRKKVKQLEEQLKEYTESLEKSQKELKENQELVSKLIDKVKELTKAEFDNRPMLYNELNRIAPDFGIKNEIPLKKVGEYTVSGKERERTKEEEIEGLLRQNPNKSAKFVFLGLVQKMHIDQGSSEGNLVQLEGPHALLTNKSKDKIFVVPFSQMKDLNEKVHDKQADEIFEEWHNYDADDKNYTIQWPVEQKNMPVGWAHDIYYVSDKILRDYDRKGKMNVYHHEFDEMRRPAFLKGKILIVSNLDIDERGILN